MRQLRVGEPQRPFVVETTDDSISIRTTMHYGVLNPNDDVLFWRRDEWEDAPSLSIAIVKAIKTAYENPDELYTHVTGLTEKPRESRVASHTQSLAGRNA